MRIGPGLFLSSQNTRGSWNLSQYQSCNGMPCGGDALRAQLWRKEVDKCVCYSVNTMQKNLSAYKEPRQAVRAHRGCQQKKNFLKCAEKISRDGKKLSVFLCWRVRERDVMFFRFLMFFIVYCRSGPGVFGLGVLWAGYAPCQVCLPAQNPALGRPYPGVFLGTHPCALAVPEGRQPARDPPDQRSSNNQEPSQTTNNQPHSGDKAAPHINPWAETCAQARRSWNRSVTSRNGQQDS